MRACIARPLAHRLQVTQLTKADAPLPSLGPVLQEVQQEVLRGRGFALIKGLPVQRWSRLTTVVAYVAIGLHWGRPVRQNQRAHLVGHVSCAGRAAVDTEAPPAACGGRCSQLARADSACCRHGVVGLRS